MTLAKSILSFVPSASSQAKAALIDFICIIPLHTAEGHSKVCHIRHSSPRCPKSNDALLPKKGFCFYPFTCFVLASWLAHVSLNYF